MSLKEVLSDIQTKLHVPKNRKNNFGGYNYRNCEDILDAVKKVLPVGFSVVVDDEVVQKGDRFYVCAVASLRSEKESVTARGWAREADSKKGMDASQLTGATSSYARKYALCGLFAIDDGVDADAHDNRSVSSASPSPGGGSNYKVTDKQLKRMFAISKKHNISQEKLKTLIKTYGNVDSSKDLTKEAYDKVCTAMEGIKG